MVADSAEKTEFLIKAGADVNAKDKNGTTALINAKTAKQTKLLLEAGADVNACDSYGRTALSQAKTTEQTDILIKAGADVKLVGILFNANAEQTKLLLEAGATVDKYTFASSFEINKIKLLIKAGADVNSQNPNGNTALTIATSNSNIEVIKLLLASGADVNLKNNNGDTAMHWARTPEIAKLLLKAGTELEQLLKNENLSVTQKSQLIEEFQKEKEIQAQISKNKERLKNKLKQSGKSGVVIADEIAKKQISGEETRVITPQVGKQLRQELIKEMNSKKARKE